VDIQAAACASGKRSTAVNEYYGQLFSWWCRFVFAVK